MRPYPNITGPTTRIPEYRNAGITMPVSEEEEDDLLSFDVGAVISKAAAEQEARCVFICMVQGSATAV